MGNRPVGGQAQEADVTGGSENLPPHQGEDRAAAGGRRHGEQVAPAVRGGGLADRKRPGRHEIGSIWRGQAGASFGGGERLLRLHWHRSLARAGRQAGVVRVQSAVAERPAAKAVAGLLSQRGGRDGQDRALGVMQAVAAHPAAGQPRKWAPWPGSDDQQVAGDRAVRKATAARAAPLVAALRGWAPGCRRALVSVPMSGSRNPAAPGMIQPGSVAFIDARSGRLVGDVPASPGVGFVRSGLGSVWEIEDAGVLLQINPRTRQLTRSISVGVYAGDVAVGEGAVWITDKDSQTLLRVGPRYGDVAHIRLPTSGLSRPSVGGGVAVGAGSVWVAQGLSRILRINPAAARSSPAFRLQTRTWSPSVAARCGWPAATWAR
jgi:hypothetical protein